FPLARCALMVEAVDPVVRIFGVGTALLGVGYAILQQDTKRVLASSTISQLGLILAAPEVGGFYALSHGLVKALLFLIAGNLPSRSLKELRSTSIHTPMWILLVIASLSISGMPLLVGFGAKIQTLSNLEPWQDTIMNVAVVGTAIVYAKFIFLPHQNQENPKKIKSGFWIAAIILLGGLIAGNAVYLEAYTASDIVKALVKIGIGWLVYWLIVRRTTITIPRTFEKFDHLIGMMSLVSMLLFWMVLARSGI
ncbi:MAG: proton-conducting transporter membrane subunit, partial [Cyanobacteriota bacterium]|nr:proton-conducting transporter membrane subunit [Cyanobacteriota bacterium]